MNLLNIISNVRQHWQKQGVLSSVNTIASINKICALKNITLPADFVLFYSHLNGMENYMIGSTNFDEEGFLFYPLDCIDFESKLISSGYLINNESDVVFAEYMHGSWHYVFRILENGSYSIGKNMGSGYEHLASTLSEFLELYLRDDERLYPS